MGALLLVLLVLAMNRPGVKSQAWVAGKPVDVEFVVIDAKGHQLRRDAAEAFMQMRAAAAAAGVELVVESAFRTWAEQKVFYDDFVAGRRKDVAAPPGWSNHQGGTAVDLDTDRGTNDAYDWLVANAHLYGFRRTVASEPWHWEYL